MERGFRIELYLFGIQCDTIEVVGDDSSDDMRIFQIDCHFLALGKFIELSVGINSGKNNIFLD